MVSRVRSYDEGAGGKEEQGRFNIAREQCWIRSELGNTLERLVDLFEWSDILNSVITFY